MNERYAEDDLDFSNMSGYELGQIVTSSSGRYRQELVDGAKKELEKRRADNVRAESNQLVASGQVQPPLLVENVSGHRLFSTAQIAVASFLGAPISGCLLIAQNHRALGKLRSAWQPLVIGFTSTMLLLLLALFLPANFPNFGLPVGSCLGVYVYAKQQGGDPIDNYLRAGGRKGSWWVMIVVSLACAVISLILFIAIAIAFGIEPPADKTSQPVALVQRLQSSKFPFTVRST